MPAFTFVASAAAARYVGAEPVLCDVRRRARLQPRPRGRRARGSRRARAPSWRCTSAATRPTLARAARALRRARARPDRGLRPGDRRARRRQRAPGRDGRRARRVQLLLEEAALRGRGRDGVHRRRRAAPRACGCCARTRSPAAPGTATAATTPPTTWSTSASTSASTSRARRSASAGSARLEQAIGARRALVRAYRERLRGAAGSRARLRRASRRALLALRLPGPAARPRRPRPLPRGAQGARHPDHLVPGAAHLQRVPRRPCRAAACPARWRSPTATARCRSARRWTRPPGTVVEAVRDGARLTRRRSRLGRDQPVRARARTPPSACS